MHDRGAPFWIGCALLATLIAGALFAEQLAPHPPLRVTGPPLSAPGGSHPLGTNDLGQDQLSLLLHGARSTLFIAFAVALLSTVASWAVGLLAGFFPRLDAPLMGITDLLLALPNLPLYLLVLTLMGPSRRNVIAVLVMLSWPPFARIVRGTVLSSRFAPHIEASRALGARERHIVWRHQLPATFGLLPSKVITTVRFAVFAEATFSFLGLGGVRTSWGMMLNWAFNDPLLFVRPQWIWLVLPPALAIVCLVLATTLISTELDAGLPATRVRSASARAASGALPEPRPQREVETPARS